MTTDKAASAPVMIFNRELNAEVSVDTVDTFKAFWTNLNTLEKGVDELDQSAFAKLTSKMAFGGIPDEVDSALNKLSELEAAAAEAAGVPRQRKARAGVADTAFVVPPNFRAYKRIIKSALSEGVELLDPEGFPRGKNEVVRALEELKSADDKPAITKLMTCTSTWTSILAKCDPATDMVAIKELAKIISDAVAVLA